LNSSTDNSSANKEYAATAMAKALSSEAGAEAMPAHSEKPTSSRRRLSNGQRCCRFDLDFDLTEHAKNPRRWRDLPRADGTPRGNIDRPAEVGVATDSDRTLSALTPAVALKQADKNL
jgi:hypothetical protein